MTVSRRIFMTSLLVFIASSAIAHPGPHRHPHRPRRWHRIRSRAWWRTIRGRRVLVVPTTLAVGWELLVDDQVIVVKEIQEHKIFVEYTDGSQESLEVVKEDTE